MKYIVYLIVSVVLSSNLAFSQAKKKAEKDTKAFRYEIECVENAKQGAYLIKVWTYSKKANVALEQCKKNAVHGVIFKGYSGKNNCVPQQALVRNAGAEVEHAAFFEKFFENGGEYMRFVSVTDGSKEISKYGKEYKVGLIVSVAKDDLRKTLEAAGVVKGLGSGF